MALAALNTGKRSPSTIVMDNGVFMFGGHKFRSPENEQGGAMDMRRAIVKSSNVYFYSLANELGVDLIHEQNSPLGFGRLTGIDLKGEVTGILPSTEWKRKTYKRPEMKKWYAGETISLGIGQGYNNFTMLQLASAQATLLAKGRRYAPRAASGWPRSSASPSVPPSSFSVTTYSTWRPRQSAAPQSNTEATCGWCRPTRVCMSPRNRCRISGRALSSGWIMRTTTGRCNCSSNASCTAESVARPLRCPIRYRSASNGRGASGRATPPEC